MLDAQIAPATPPVAIRREDYRPPDWLVPEIALQFNLDAERTIVTAVLTVDRNGDHSEPLRLNGEGLKLLSVSVDGAPAQHEHADGVLTVGIDKSRAKVETRVEIAPEANTQLMGLY